MSLVSCHVLGFVGARGEILIINGTLSLSFSLHSTLSHKSCGVEFIESSTNKPLTLSLELDSERLSGTRVPSVRAMVSGRKIVVVKVLGLQTPCVASRSIK